MWTSTVPRWQQNRDRTFSCSLEKASLEIKQTKKPKAHIEKNVYPHATLGCLKDITDTHWFHSFTHTRSPKSTTHECLAEVKTRRLSQRSPCLWKGVLALYASRSHERCHKSIWALLRYWCINKVYKTQFNLMFESGLHPRRLKFWSVEFRTVERRTQWLSLVSFARWFVLTPSDLRPLFVWERVTHIPFDSMLCASLYQRKKLPFDWCYSMRFYTRNIYFSSHFPPRVRLFWKMLFFAINVPDVCFARLYSSKPSRLYDPMHTANMFIRNEWTNRSSFGLNACKNFSCFFLSVQRPANEGWKSEKIEKNGRGSLAVGEHFNSHWPQNILSAVVWEERVWWMVDLPTECQQW